MVDKGVGKDDDDVHLTLSSHKISNKTYSKRKLLFHRIKTKPALFWSTLTIINNTLCSNYTLWCVSILSISLNIIWFAYEVKLIFLSPESSIWCSFAIWRSRCQRPSTVRVLTFYTLISVCIFSILFSINFLLYFLGEFVKQSRTSWVCNIFHNSHSINVWLRCWEKLDSYHL